MSDRDGSGRLLPGHAALPGAGRPKGYKGVAKRIMRETQDGTELVSFALRVLRDPDEDMAHRRWAAEWLSSYGLGKPVARTELEAHVSAVGAARIDVRALAAALPAELVQAVTAALDGAGDTLLLPAAEDDAE